MAPVFERCMVTGLCCCLWSLGQKVEGLFQFCQMSAFRTEPSLAAAGPGYISSKQHPRSLCCLFPLRLCPLQEVIKVALLPLLVPAEHAAQQPVGFKVRIRSKMKERTTVSSPAYLSSVQPHSPIQDLASPNHQWHPVQDASSKQQTKQNTNPVISRQDYHLTQPCQSEEKQTNKNSAQISPYRKLTQTTGPT